MISVIKIVFPIAAAFVLGILAKRTGVICAADSDTLKKLVGKILLPLILFDAFLFADYSLKTLVIIVSGFLAMLASFGIAHLTRKAIPSRARYAPFVLSTLELGTLGYPFVALLFGKEGTGYAALLDAGNAIFLFGIAVPFLIGLDGSSNNPKEVVLQALKSPQPIAIGSGIVLGVLGLDRLIASSAVAEIYTAAISYLTAPVGVLILLTLSYDLSFKKDLMKTVLYTSVIRYIVMMGLCALTLGVISIFYPLTAVIIYTTVLCFALPASYAILMFSKFEGHQDYVSTSLSFSTILYLITYVVISAISAA